MGKIRILLTLCLFLAAGVVVGEEGEPLVLLEYNGGTPASPTVSPTYTNDEITATALIAAGGLNAMTSVTNHGNPAPTPRSSPKVSWKSTADESWDAGQFYSFTVTPGRLCTLTLTNLTFHHKSDKHSHDIYVRSSLDPSTNLCTFRNGENWLLCKVTLGQEFKGLTEPITFYIGNCDGFYGRPQYHDNIKLIGMAILPPPGTVLAIY